MDAPLDAMQQDFMSRVGGVKALERFAFQSRRWIVTLVVCLLPAVLLVAAVAWGPSELGKAATSAQNVHETFARFISAVATASAIAVSVATMTMSRELKGIRTHERRSHDNDEFRDRVRRASGRESMPVGLGEFCSAAYETLAADARRAARLARETGSNPELGGARLVDYLDSVAQRAESCAAETFAHRRHPNALMHAAYDFEQELTAQYARRFARLEELPDALRAQLLDVLERLLDVATISKYTKTMDLQWGLSRMSMAITLASIPSLVTAAGMVLLYGQGAVDAFGRLGAAILVAGALALVLMPLAMFVSYVIRFVFLNQHTLPTEGFIVGPEAPRIVERASSGTARRRSQA